MRSLCSSGCLHGPGTSWKGRGAVGAADVLQAAGKCCNYQKGAEGQAGRRGCGGEVTAK